MWGNLPAFGGQEAHHQSSNFLLKSTIVTRVGSEETPPEHPKREISSSRIQVKIKSNHASPIHIINPSHQRVQRVLKSTLASGIRFMQESFSQPHARQDKTRQEPLQSPPYHLHPCNVLHQCQMWNSAVVATTTLSSCRSWRSFCISFYFILLSSTCHSFLSHQRSLVPLERLSILLVS